MVDETGVEPAWKTINAKGLLPEDVQDLDRVKGGQDV